MADEVGTLAGEAFPRGDLPDGGISIGRVFALAFATLIRSPLTVLGIAFLFAAFPSTLLDYATQRLQVPLPPEDGVAAAAVMVAIALLGSVFSIMAEGALVTATIARSEGGSAGFRATLLEGLRHAVPLFLLGLVATLATAIGFVLLIIPGVILTLMWAVAGPAMVAERLGVVAALGRSAYLTSGVRMAIFGILIIEGLIALAIGALGGVGERGMGLSPGGAGAGAAR
jgi:hypothetical protein